MNIWIIVPLQGGPTVRPTRVVLRWARGKRKCAVRLRASLVARTSRRAALARLGRGGRQVGGQAARRQKRRRWWQGGACERGGDAGSAGMAMGDAARIMSSVDISAFLARCCSPRACPSLPLESSDRSPSAPPQSLQRPRTGAYSSSRAALRCAITALRFSSACASASLRSAAELSSAVTSGSTSDTRARRRSPTRGRAT